MELVKKSQTSLLRPAAWKYARWKQMTYGEPESLWCSSGRLFHQLRCPLFSTMNPATIALVVSFAIDEYKVMGLDRLVLQAGKVL